MSDKHFNSFHNTYDSNWMCFIPPHEVTGPQILTVKTVKKTSILDTPVDTTTPMNFLCLSYIKVGYLDGFNRYLGENKGKWRTCSLQLIFSF